MKHAVAHDLGEERARLVAQAAFNSYKEKFGNYDPKANWVDDRRCEISFNVKGIKLNGAMQVFSDKIEMDLDVPFMLRPFKGKALRVIEGEIQKWVAKAKAGEI